MEECPVCMEALSNVTTRVTTECCNNVLHLKCLKKCNYKCPLCRNDDLVVDMAPPCEVVPLIQTRVIRMPHDHFKGICLRTFHVSAFAFCVLGGIHYYLMMFPPPLSSPPPPS